MRPLKKSREAAHRRKMGKCASHINLRRRADGALKNSILYVCVVHPPAGSLFSGLTRASSWWSWECRMQERKHTSHPRAAELEIKSSERGGWRALYYICLIKQRVHRQINNRTHHALSLSQRKMLHLHIHTQKIYANSTLRDEWRSSRSAVLTE